MQCSVLYVLYQKTCGSRSCFGHTAGRRLLAGRTYGELAAEYTTPHNWIPVDSLVRPSGLPHAQRCCTQVFTADRARLAVCAITRHTVRPHADDRAHICRARQTSARRSPARRLPASSRASTTSMSSTVEQAPRHHCECGAAYGCRPRDCTCKRSVLPAWRLGRLKLACLECLLVRLRRII